MGLTHCTPGFDVISRRSVIQNSGKQILKSKCKWSSFSQWFSEVCFSALQLTLRSTLIPKHQSSLSQNLCKRSWAKMEKGQTVPQLSKRSMLSYQLQESHLKYAPVCQGSTCKQSAARSETPKA